MLSKEMIGYLHDSGQMPDWAYYQQNGKSASENIRDQRKRELLRQQERDLAKYKARREAEIEAELEEQLEEKLPETLDKVFDDLFKDWQ